MRISPEQAQLAISGASVLFAAALTVVTYLYYTETKNQTDELKKTRKSEFQPVLKPTIDSWEGVLMRFAFENTGKGAAHNASIKWWFSNTDFVDEWETPLISPGERHLFHLPFDSDEPIIESEEIESRLEDDEKLIFSAIYEDPLGNEYSTKDTVDILNIIKTHGPAKERSEDTLANIAKQLQTLNKNVSDLQEPFFMTDIKEQIHSRSVKQVLDTLNKHNELTMRELKAISGLSTSAEKAVQDLSETNIVELENEEKEEPLAFHSDTVVRLSK